MSDRLESKDIRALEGHLGMFASGLNSITFKPG